MKNVVKAAKLLGGIAVASAGIAVPVAQAEPSVIPGITVLTIVKWSGTDCISARTATGQRDMCNTIAQPHSDSVVEHGRAVGDLVGVDPAMGHAAWATCEMFLNGNRYMSDSALAGDGSDVTRLKVMQ